MWDRTLALAAAAALASGTAARAQEQPAQHTVQPVLAGLSDAQAARAGADGLTTERARDPVAVLEQHRRLAATLGELKPQRPGVVDAYVVVAALDSDPVFAREARAAAEVLARRYDAAGRTVVLAGPDGRGGAAHPFGSPDALEAALARVAEVMDRREDVLVLYTTSHGAPWGLAYDDGDTGFGMLGPRWLRAVLGSLGIERRLLLISACYSGVFAPALASARTVIMTAASAERSSFGCQADNDWTFFGDALVNHALRSPQPFAAAAAGARTQIAAWEKAGRERPSQPQLSIGADTGWLAALDAHLPPASEPVGRPAIDVLKR